MRYLLFVLMYIGAFNAAASEAQPLIAHVIKGKLMVVPDNDQENVEQAKTLFKRNNGSIVAKTVAWIQVWAYNCSSVHWARDGNRQLDEGRRRRKFCTHLPLSHVQHLKEDNLLVLKWGDKELHLTCAQYGMRFGDITFEQQVNALDL